MLLVRLVGDDLHTGPSPVQEEKVNVREDIVFGLENAPEAFIGLLQGKNFGKLVIQLAHE